MKTSVSLVSTPSDELVAARLNKKMRMNERRYPAAQKKTVKKLAGQPGGKAE